MLDERVDIIRKSYFSGVLQNIFVEWIEIIGEDNFIIEGRVMVL